MKRIIAIAFLLSLYTTAASAQDSVAAGGPAAQIKFINLDTTYDFGFVPAETVSQYTFEFKNTGTGNLVITDVHTELKYIKIQWPNKPIKHGKKGLITVSASPHEIGSFKDDLVITSNATAAPYPFLHISGAVIPSGDPGTPGSSSAPKSSKRAGRGN